MLLDTISVYFRKQVQYCAAGGNGTAVKKSGTEAKKKSIMIYKKATG